MRTLFKSVGLASTLFASAQEFLAAYQPSQAGCLVLDIRMPGMSGLELQQQLNMRGAVIPAPACKAQHSGDAAFIGALVDASAVLTFGTGTRISIDTSGVCFAWQPNNLTLAQQ